MHPMAPPVKILCHLSLKNFWNVRVEHQSKGDVAPRFTCKIVVKVEVVFADGDRRSHIPIQHELLEQVDTFPYLGSLITEDGECTTEFRTRLNRGQAIEASLQKIWKSHNTPISTKIRLMKALV